MKLIPKILPLTAMLLLAGCSSTEPDNPEPPAGVPGEVTVKISSRDMPGNGGSDSFSPLDNEKINSWCMAFVSQQDNKVVKVCKTDKESPVEEDGIKVYVESGTYSIFAFANMQATLSESGTVLTVGLPKGSAEETLFTFEEGKTVNISDIKGKTTTAISNTGNTSLEIPMSGILENVKVESGAADQTTVTVYRMYGKMEFAVTNESTNKITVEEVSVVNLAAGATKVFGTPEPGKAPVMTAGTEYSTFSMKGNWEIQNGTGNNTGSLHCYVKEVTSNHPTGSFPISLKIKRGDGESDLLTALLYEINYINRNDWIRVPIRIKDWSLDLTTTFYPPIGGYPPVIRERKDGEYYAIFGTEGWFAIQPSVYENTGDKTALPNDRIVINSITIENITGNIFSTSPTVDATTGEITGVLDSSIGHSVVTLEIKVKANETDESPMDWTFTRKIHIMRQNG